jgi:hypothetical protein
LLFFAAGFRLALTIVVLVAFFLPVVFLAGLFFTALFEAAFFVVTVFGFRVVLFLGAVTGFFETVPFFLEVVVLLAFVLFAFVVLELRRLGVFFSLVLALVLIFPEGVLFLGIVLFLLIHSISVFLFMW